MKKILIVALLLAVMLMGMLNVHAAEAEMKASVLASKTEVQVGDTVEYTVVVSGRGVYALQFEVDVPEGLRYVPSSGATPEGLAQKLGIPAADWTEQTKMFTCFNHVDIPFGDGTQILSFSCVAEKEGDWDVVLNELLPFGSDFQSFAAELQVQTITVTGGAGDTKPAVTDETDSPVTPPSATETHTATEPANQETQPTEQVPDQTVTQPEGQQTPDPTEPSSDQTGSKQEETPNTEEVPQPVQPQHGMLKWILSLGGVLLIACGAGIFHIFKKKHS